MFKYFYLILWEHIELFIKNNKKSKSKSKFNVVFRTHHWNLYCICRKHTVLLYQILQGKWGRDSGTDDKYQPWPMQLSLSPSCFNSRGGEHLWHFTCSSPCCLFNHFASEFTTQNWKSRYGLMMPRFRIRLFQWFSISRCQ